MHVVPSSPSMNSKKGDKIGDNLLGRVPNIHISDV